MAAFGRFLMSLRPCPLVGRQISVTTVPFADFQRGRSCETQKCLVHVSSIGHKGDKYSLTSSKGKRKRKFRAGRSQDYLATGKLETFKLDPLHDEDEQTTTSKSARLNALEATLEQAMSDLLDSNDVDEELFNYDIQITNVKITPDMGHVMFHWTMDMKDQIANAAELLHQNENSLRLLLRSYHHLNISPRVTFSYDKHVDYLANVQSLLDSQESQNDN